LSGGDAGFAALQLSFELLGIDLEQELSGLDAFTLLDGDTSNTSRGVRRDVDLTLGLNLPGSLKMTVFFWPPIMAFSLAI
jgi:hypothetical protein